MADDWRINEKYRKPRKTKGTPFFVQRNYYAAGTIAIGGLCWYLYELWSPAQKLKQSLIDGKFADPPGLRIKHQHMQESLKSVAVAEILAKAREREYDRQEPPEKETGNSFWDMLKRKPDL